MFELIQQNVGTAVRRRAFFTLIDSADHVSGKDIVVAGVKARISKNGGASALTANDIVKVDAANMPGVYYVELVVGEVDTLGVITGYLKPAACDAAEFQVFVVDYDPYADGASAADVAAAVLAAAAAAPIAANMKRVNDIVLVGDGDATPWGPA